MDISETQLIVFLLLAAVAAIRAGETKYTALTGTPALKDAIQRKFKRDHGLEYDRDEIIVSSGAKQVIYNAFMASLEPGDEVVVPVPFWTSYADMISLAGGRVVQVPCAEENGFRMTREQLRGALSDRTRWVLFNSPCNPSGAAYGAKHYAPLLEELRGLDAGAIQALEAVGVRSVEQLAALDLESVGLGGVDPRALDRARRQARLAVHKGMGAPMAGALMDVGVADVGELAESGDMNGSPHHTCSS